MKSQDTMNQGGRQNRPGAGGKGMGGSEIGTGNINQDKDDVSMADEDIAEDSDLEGVEDMEEVDFDSEENDFESDENEDTDRRMGSRSLNENRDNI